MSIISYHFVYECQTFHLRLQGSILKCCQIFPNIIWTYLTLHSSIFQILHISYQTLSTQLHWSFFPPKYAYKHPLCEKSPIQDLYMHPLVITQHPKMHIYVRICRSLSNVYQKLWYKLWRKIFPVHDDHALKVDKRLT